MTRDIDKAAQFYGEVMGWTADKVSKTDPDRDYWFTYLSVADVDKACEHVVATGGRVLRPVYDVPYVGRIAVIEDPDGAVVGIGTPVVRKLA